MSNPYTKPVATANEIHRLAVALRSNTNDAATGEVSDSDVIEGAINIAREALRLIYQLDARSFEANDLDQAYDVINQNCGENKDLDA